MSSDQQSPVKSKVKPPPPPPPLPPTPISIKISAPGKVILHGEHSVVYGKLALAASLDLRTTVHLEEDLSQTDPKLQLNFFDLNYRKHFPLEKILSAIQDNPFPVEESRKKQEVFLNPEYIKHEEFLSLIKTSLNIRNNDLCVVSLLYLYFGIILSTNIEIEPLVITVSTDLTLGAGTGSSASFMVCLAAAFMHYLILKYPGFKDLFTDKNRDTFTEFQLNLISRWAFAGERIIHGNPSGIDNTICTYGSMVSFRKGRAPFAIKCRSINALLIDTKVTKNTAMQLKKVAELIRKYPHITNHLMDALECVAEEALECLIQLEQDMNKSNDVYVKLSDLVTINQSLLRTLQVSHPKIENVLDILSKHKFNGKLTGAGGGGYVLCIIPPGSTPQEVADVCNDLDDHGYQPIITKLGSMGVRIERT